MCWRGHAWSEIVPVGLPHSEQGGVRFKTRRGGSSLLPRHQRDHRWTTLANHDVSEAFEPSVPPPRFQYRRQGKRCPHSDGASRRVWCRRISSTNQKRSRDDHDGSRSLDSLAICSQEIGSGKVSPLTGGGLIRVRRPLSADCEHRRWLCARCGRRGRAQRSGCRTTSDTGYPRRDASR